MASVVGVYLGCFSCVEFVHGISNWTEGIGECYTFGHGFEEDWLNPHRHWLQTHRKLVRQAMYSKSGGRGRRRRPYSNRNQSYIFRYRDEKFTDFDYVYKLNNSCVSVLGVVAVETLLCFGIFDNTFYKRFQSKIFNAN